MAKRKRTKPVVSAAIVDTDDKLAPVTEFLRIEIEQQFTRREALRKTLLNTLRVSAYDLNETITYGTIREARAFTQLAEDGPTYAAVLRHIAELIEFASERINEAIMLRSDAVDLFEHSAAQLKKSLS